METQVEKSDHLIYKNALRERSKMIFAINSTNIKIMGLNDFFEGDAMKERKKGFESTGKKFEDATLNLRDAGGKVEEQKRVIIKQEDTLKLITKSLTDRKYTTNPELLSFLKEHNSKQDNFLKRLFGIEKDPKSISRQDRERLTPLAQDKFTTIIEKQNDKLNNLQIDKGFWENAVNLQNSQKLLSKQTGELHLAKSKISQIEKPLKAAVEKIIDLDIKDLRSFLSKNNVSIKSLMLFVTDAIKNIAKYGLGQNNDSVKDKVIEIGENLKTLNKEDSISQKAGVSR